MSEFSRPFNWTDPIPQEKRIPELIRVPAAEVLKGIVVSDAVWELETHWHNRRTRP